MRKEIKELMKRNEGSNPLSLIGGNDEDNRCKTFRRIR